MLLLTSYGLAGIGTQASAYTLHHTRAALKILKYYAGRRLFSKDKKRKGIEKKNAKRNEAL